MQLQKPNSQYSRAAPIGFADRLGTYQRRAMYHRFLQETAAMPDDTILDVGVTSDRTYSSSNYLEAWYPHKSNVTGTGTDDASFLEQLYPGVRFVRANGLDLPFRDGAFDIVHSAAVLEHVGSLAQQIVFVRECARVARKSVFLTTPNRWFPIEFHTLLPCVHWLPKPLFRTILRRLRLEFFSHEEHLNLMSRRELLGAALHVKTFAFEVSSVSLLGWPSNLLLIGHRTPVRTGCVPETQHGLITVQQSAPRIVARSDLTGQRAR
jgi:hypothetical protein